eukprot:SAG11_NODE_16332_length_550_cov_1.203991_1_plen_54_part_01
MRRVVVERAGRPKYHKYKVSFFECNQPNGGRALNNSITDNIILTLRVELLEEEI